MNPNFITYPELHDESQRELLKATELLHDTLTFSPHGKGRPLQELKEAVSKAFEAGVDPHSRSNLGGSAIGLALDTRQPTIVKLFFATGKFEASHLLEKAFETRHVGIMQCVLEEMQNELGSDLSQSDFVKNGHAARLMHKAAEAGEVGIMQVLNEFGISYKYALGVQYHSGFVEKRDKLELHVIEFLKREHRNEVWHTEVKAEGDLYMLKPGFYDDVKRKVSEGPDFYLWIEGPAPAVESQRAAAESSDNDAIPRVSAQRPKRLFSALSNLAQSARRAVNPISERKP